ncbi:prolyl oligopeptidase family serine peptidase [Flavobacterium sp.]
MRLLNLLAIVVFVQTSFAQEKSQKPGDASLPSSKEELLKIANSETGKFAYSVEDYFSKPQLSSFQISPNGQYISYREKDKAGKRHIYVKEVKTNKITKVVEEKDELVRQNWWANDSRILYLKDKGGDENYLIYGVDIDGTNFKELTPFKNVTVSLLDELKTQKDFIIISMNKENAEVFEPYKLNIVTGNLTKLFDNTDLENPVDDYNFDKKGTLRAYRKQVNGNTYQLWYRTNESSPFELIATTDWKVSFGIMGFNYQSKNPDEAYVYSNINTDKLQISRYDLKKKKELEVMYANDTYDISSLSFSYIRGNEPNYYQYEAEKNVLVPISATYKKMFAVLDKSFKDKLFAIIGNTDNEDQFLLYVYSDKLYGAYYRYDYKLEKVEKITDLMPQLNENDMAEIRPIQFKSRDGLDLYGYLTIPKMGTNVPLIVNPHGGPYGPRDGWGYNPETQLFASRGYATLQVNYRGSGGYGKEFSEAGSKQIGRKMLDDLEDGVAYAISLGFINKDKIAIYGGSYGGLATLGSLIKTPDLYKCGVDYVGVSNLFTFFETIPEYWKPYTTEMYEQWYDPTDEADRKIMTEVSPALNTDKITKPLLIVQGANDPRVNIKESDQVVRNLRKRGIKVPYMVKYNEGHGFGHEDNQIDFYKTMIGFFNENLK